MGRSRVEVMAEIKALIAGVLNGRVVADEIGDDVPLFDERVGIDSVAAVEILVAVEERFGIEIDDESVTTSTFATVRSLASVVATHLARGTGESGDVQGP